jgi:alpha-glucosidase
LSIESNAGNLAQGDVTIGNQIMDKLVVLGMVSYAGKNVTACVYDEDFVPRVAKAEYDVGLQAVVVSAADKDVLFFKDITSIQFSDSDNDQSFCNVAYTINRSTKYYDSEDANITTRIVLEIASQGTPALPDLEVDFTLMDDEIIRVQIYDPTAKEFRAPNEAFDHDFIKGGSKATIDISTVLNLPKDGELFYYEIHDFEQPASIYYSTKDQKFLHSKYYKRHTAQIESSGKIFGLGSRVGDFFLDEGVYTIWNRDDPSPVEDGKRPGKNIYGTHPVYFTQTNTKSYYFGVFDHNVGAQDFIIKKNGKLYDITSIKTSGITDQFIIMRTSLERAVQNYQRIVGKPIMVPEWGLGWHQCRYGYNTSKQADDVVTNYLKNNIPLDVMWTDIDYMEQYRDFTLSETNFADLKKYVQGWWANSSVRYIPILDAAIAYETSGTNSFSRGSRRDIFIKDSNDHSKPFIGKVWPGPAVYIDWYNVKAEGYWLDEMERLNDILPFNGMWIDMNEASNF